MSTGQTDIDASAGAAYVEQMVTLYQFKSIWGLPNPSPFCFKIENYLRMSGIAFQTRRGDPRKAPKKKLPFIDDDGVVVSDSADIIDHLKKTRGDKLDAALTPAERAEAHILVRMLDEAFYWILVYNRWADDAGFEVANREILQPALPPILRIFLPGIIRKSVVSQLHAQGTGRHEGEKIFAKGAADLAALATVLGDKPYFLGDEPTSVDASAYAFLGVLLWSPPEGVMAGHVRSHENLVAYCERMKKRYYADVPAALAAAPAAATA